MAASVQGKQRTWSVSQDREGHRDYKIKWLVKALKTDGPNTVLNASGLPAVGSEWAFDDDFDPWAFCKFEASANLHQHNEGDPHLYWIVEQTFSTKPDFKCNDNPVDNPLLEPQAVSGSFVKEKKEAVRDRHGVLIKSSSHEQFRGEKTEFEINRPTVKIGQNVSTLELALFAQMVNTVNEVDMWGLPPRCVKLSNASWERKLYGQCFVYFHREFEFDVNFNTFDRFLLDEGTKVLHGEWNTDANGVSEWIVTPVEERNSTDGLGTITGYHNPDPSNPRDFVRFKDRNGENTRVILNGHGLPAATTIWTEAGQLSPQDPYPVKVEYYPESNFSELDVPVDLEA